MRHTWETHPCQTCGACCASFRVSFLNLEKFKTPSDKTVPLGEGINCMKGTEEKHRPKCQSLQGKIGKHTECTIYENRPDPCRNFKASYETGYKEKRCDEARHKHGLHPLTKSDWLKKENVISE